MLFAYACEELLREPAHGKHGRVDACNDLWDDLIDVFSSTN